MELVFVLKGAAFESLPKFVSGYSALPAAERTFVRFDEDLGEGQPYMES